MRLAHFFSSLYRQQLFLDARVAERYSTFQKFTTTANSRNPRQRRRGGSVLVLGVRPRKSNREQEHEGTSPSTAVATSTTVAQQTDRPTQTSTEAPPTAVMPDKPRLLFWVPREKSVGCCTTINGNFIGYHHCCILSRL